MSDAARLRKRTVTVSGHVTSVSLEEAFWEALKRLAERRCLSVNALISEIDESRTGNLSSAIRVYLLRALEAGGEE